LGGVPARRPALAVDRGNPENVAVRSGVLSCFIGAAVLGLALALLAQSGPKHAPAPPPEMRVDINHASLDDLLKVSGMTHPWALRIIRFRPYRTKMDLVDRGVITDEVYNRFKDEIIAHRDEQK
jgi:DNA uptake protein ComE-like DNA-binding protein